MLAHPQFDPVAISLGPISVHWYGLMYLFAFAQFWWLGKRRLHTLQPTITTEQLDDL
ncbi:MAG TPA: prolipoprotein diacylglyceryl transferase, partial [Rhodocyclaceae bacterium]|nr:prolipoprotein diacylglyceryl transferase [Rhodocyclaceae bacterium]